MNGPDAYRFFLLLARAARERHAGASGRPVVTLDAMFAEDLRKLTPRELSEIRFDEAELPKTTIERLSGDLLQGSYAELERLHGVEVKVMDGPPFVLVDTGALSVDSGTLLFCGKNGGAETDWLNAKSSNSRSKAEEHAATMSDPFVPWSVKALGSASATAEPPADGSR